MLRVPEFRCNARQCVADCAAGAGCVHAQYKCYAYVNPERLAEGWSRIAVGVHFPTDVLAGWCLGALCAWAAWRLPVPDDARLRQWLARWR